MNFTLKKLPTKYAPIALFVYTRRAHARKTIDALKNNLLAGESDLFIFSDGPKSQKDASLVDEVRHYVKGIDGFRSVVVVERDRNFGLANSIIDGVTLLCDQFGRVIVVEDDIVTSEHFLTYMNDGLRVYEGHEKVYAISACTYPLDLSDISADTFFLRLPLCWGWATWKEKWACFEKSLVNVPAVDNSIIEYMNFEGAHDFFRQARENYRGRLNTWFIFWYLALARRRAFSLYPKNSLATNIGMDGTGENCGISTVFTGNLSHRPIHVERMSPYEDEYVLRQHRKFFDGLRRPLVKRAWNRVSSAIRGAVWG